MRKYLVTMAILLLLLLSGTAAQNAANAVTIQEQDFTGDGTLDVKMDNGIMWLQVNRDTPSGLYSDFKGFIDAGGITGGPNLLGCSIISNGMVDQLVSWLPESYAIDILENSPDRGIFRVTVVDTGNGKEITKEFTITLQAGAQNSWIDYLFTNTGASSFYYDQDPGHIHDGAYLAWVQSAELSDIDAYISGVGTIGLTSFNWWSSYTPDQGAPFGVLYRPSGGETITFGFKSWDYPIHQIVAYYTGASPTIEPRLDFMASAFTLDVGASVQWSVVVAFHDGGYLEGIDIYNQATRPLLGWCDDFELYQNPSDWTLNWHGSGNVDGIAVDNTTSFTGSQSLRMFGQLGGCWGAVATRPIQMDLPLEISFAVKNGSEPLSGCHQYRATLGLRTGPDWPDCPCPPLVRVLPNGDIELPYFSPATIFSGYALGSWHNVRSLLSTPGDGYLHMKLWVNASYLGEYTLPEEPWMSETAYLDISSSEGTAWFDDICVNPLAAPADTLIVGQPDCLVSVNHNNLSIPIYLNNHDTVKAMDIPLQYDWPFDPDSISFVGTRVEDFEVKIRSIDAVNKKIRIALIADNSGSGLVLPPVDVTTANIPVAKIMFHLPYQCSQEMIGAPDTCTLVLPGDNLQSLKVVDNHDVGYVPALERDSTKVLRYKPGDCNGDDNVDISDVVCLISYIFSGGTPVCLAASDANGDGMVDISDVVYLIAYIFSGGAMPGSNLLCDYQVPLAKAIPSTAELMAFAGTSGEVATMRLSISTTVETKGLQLEFETGHGVQITGIQSNIEGMDVFSGTVDGLLKVGLIDMTGRAVIPAGQHEVVTISYASTTSTGSVRAGEGEIKLVNAIVVGEDASKMNVRISSRVATTSLPTQFALQQNIPNPFNPTTEIGYALAKASPVRLEVLNVLGQVVRTLVDEFQSAGNHNTVWDGRDDNHQEVSSGVYFYRITAGEYAETRKMVLMK